MKYSISINQRAIIESGLNIDLFDAAIIDYILAFSHAKTIMKIQEGELTFYYFSYNHLIAEMPLLGLKRDAIYRRFKKLCDMGFLIAHPRNKAMNKPFYAFTPALLSFISDTYGFKTDAHVLTRLENGENPGTSGFKTDAPTVLNPMYNNTNNNNTESMGQSPEQTPPPPLLTFKDKAFTKWDLNDFSCSIKAAREKRKSDTTRANFTKSMLTAFYAYWSEPDSRGKMRFQKQDTWSTAGRLAIWETRDNQK